MAGSRTQPWQSAGTQLLKLVFKSAAGLYLAVGRKHFARCLQLLSCWKPLFCAALCGARYSLDFFLFLFLYLSSITVLADYILKQILHTWIYSLEVFLPKRCSNWVYVVVGGISLIGSFGFHSQQFFQWGKLLLYHKNPFFLNFFLDLGLLYVLQQCCKIYPRVSSGQTYFSKACWIEREKYQVFWLQQKTRDFIWVLLT